MRPDEVRQVAGLRLPEDDDYETIGGLIGDHLARIPAVGDSVTLEVDDEDGAPLEVTLTVLALDDLRVDRVRLVSVPIESRTTRTSREHRSRHRASASSCWRSTRSSSAPSSR